MGASIVSTNCFSSDTYSLTFALSTQSLKDLEYWSQLSSAYIQVIAFNSAVQEQTSLITGMVDSFHADPIRGTIGVEGRDLSSAMVESYRQQDFVNQTASEIAFAIAQYHGLTPIITPTTAVTGRYYSDGYSKLSLGQYSKLQSDWDLLVQLARQNDFDVFVQDQSLFFQPSTTTDLPITVSIRDVQRLRIERTLLASNGATANVQSWNSQHMASYLSLHPENGATLTENSSSTGIPFLFSGSNYTPQQVTDLAKRYTSELGRLKTVLHMDTPWNLLIAPRTIVLLCDTQSGFDTTYRVESIERHYSSTSGSLQTLCASQISQL